MTSFNSVEELKKFIIDEVLIDLAEKTGKPLSDIKKAFESVDYIKEMVMDKVYEVSLQLARNRDINL